jgi:hypothetical protein
MVSFVLGILNQVKTRHLLLSLPTSLLPSPSLPSLSLSPLLTLSSPLLTLSSPSSFLSLHSTGELLRTFSSHEEEVFALTVTQRTIKPILISAGMDRSIKCWRLPLTLFLSLSSSAASGGEGRDEDGGEGDDSFGLDDEETHGSGAGAGAAGTGAGAGAASGDREMREMRIGDEEITKDNLRMLLPSWGGGGGEGEEDGDLISVNRRLIWKRNKRLN